MKTIRTNYLLMHLTLRKLSLYPAKNQKKVSLNLIMKKRKYTKVLEMASRHVKDQIVKTEEFFYRALVRTTNFLRNLYEDTHQSRDGAISSRIKRKVNRQRRMRILRQGQMIQITTSRN